MQLTKVLKKMPVFFGTLQRKQPCLAYETNTYKM